MSDSTSDRRLSDLLIDPREDLGVEAKTWLDLTGNADHKAVLAKALLALANHGGGFVLIGFDDLPLRLVPSLDRPPTLDGYGQDTVNGIVQKFADPVFHCGVSFVAGQDGGVHPIVSVPGGHRVPIRAKKGSPDNLTVATNAIYIRRPGPKSEAPQTAQEWDDLFRRCVAARKEELLESIRNILSGSPKVEPVPGADVTLDVWTAQSRARWEALISALPADDKRRCPFGRYTFSYELDGDVPKRTVPELRDLLDRSRLRLTGWSPWWVPTRQEIAPYFKDDALECWIGNEIGSDAAHSDFWRVSPKGLGFLLRGYQEDGPEVAARGILPGKAYDLTLPIWRLGEALLSLQSLANNLGATESTVLFRAQYEGLAGRNLTSISQHLWDVGGGVSREESVMVQADVPVSSISANLPEIVHEMLKELYARFSLFALNIDMVRAQLGKMRSNRS